jgi:hypothetical protein
VPSVCEKLNLREHRKILVVNAPRSFEGVIKSLQGVRIQRSVAQTKDVAFALVFATKQTELDRIAKAIVARATGDALLWFAYPKGTSKRYSCELNRDRGWDVLRKSGFDCVRQVAIDEDWSALRFRRVEFINHRSR